MVARYLWKALRSRASEAKPLRNASDFIGRRVSASRRLAYRVGRGIKAGRVWTNCYLLYPAHAAFGGYKQSGIGRETHKMMLDHDQQTKNLLVSYDARPVGLF